MSICVATRAGTCTQISSPSKKEKRFALNYFGFANMFYTSYRVKLCYDLIEIYFWVGVTQHLCTVSPAWVKEKSLYHHNLVHPQRIFDTDLHVCFMITIYELLQSDISKKFMDMEKIHLKTRHDFQFTYSSPNLLMFKTTLHLLISMLRPLCKSQNNRYTSFI